MDNLKLSCCKTCGGELDPRTAVDGVVKCQFCGSLWTMPKEKTVSEAVHFLKMGEHELDTCDFDDAYTSFRKAAEIDATEPEAYFGMALATFCVQYLRDEAHKRVQPICHKNSANEFATKKFVNDANYKKALKFATPSQEKVYKERAEEINYIREEFLRLKNSGVDYDCFICVKVTDDDTGERTVDYGIADDVYFDLKGKGFKVFFSEREVRNKQGADYEAQILYALYASNCMLVVCTDDKYLQTPWVKNEYTRFLSMIADGNGKEQDSITIVFDGDPIERLPGRKGKIQGINLQNLDAVDQIRGFVTRHSTETQSNAAAVAERKQTVETKETKRVRNPQPQQEQLRSAASVDALIMRAEQFLDDDDRKSAQNYFNMALDTDPQNAQAWWGLFLLEMGVKNESQIEKDVSQKKLDEIEKSRNYRNAKKYATGSIANRVKTFENNLKSAKTLWQLFLQENEVKHEKEILNKITKNQKVVIDESANYRKACETAKGEFNSRIKDFQRQLNSFELWWSAFLHYFKWTNENDLFEKGFSITTAKKVHENKYFKQAQKNATGKDAERIDEFLQKIDEKSQISEKAIENINALCADYGASDVQQLATVHTDIIKNNVHYKNALDYAVQANDVELTELYSQLGISQEKNYYERIRNKKLDVVEIIFSVISYLGFLLTVLVPIILESTGHPVLVFGKRGDFAPLILLFAVIGGTALLTLIATNITIRRSKGHWAAMICSMIYNYTFLIIVLTTLR